MIVPEEDAGEETDLGPGRRDEPPTGEETDLGPGSTPCGCETATGPPLPPAIQRGRALRGEQVLSGLVSPSVTGPASPPGPRPLHHPADLLDAVANDPFARGSLRPGRAWGGGWAAGDPSSRGAAVWVGTDQEEQRDYLSCLGSAPAVAVLLTAIAAVLPLPARLNAPRGTADRLGRTLRFEVSGEWDFRWIGQAPPTQPGESAVRVLPAGPVTDAAVTALLEAAAPTASARPGDPHVRRWVGTGDPLVAVAADTSGRPDLGHISSVATRPDERGRGHGRAVTAGLTRLLLAEGCDVVTLGMFAGNTIARALYDQLGFHDEHHFSAGPLSRTTEQPGRS